MSYSNIIKKTLDNKRGYCLQSGAFYTDYSIYKDNEYFIIRSGNKQGDIAFKIDIKNKNVLVCDDGYYTVRMIGHALYILEERKILPSNIHYMWWSNILMNEKEFISKGTYNNYDGPTNKFSMYIPCLKSYNKKFVLDHLKKVCKIFFDNIGKNRWFESKQYIDSYYVLMDVNYDVISFLETLKKEVGHFEYRTEDDKHIHIISNKKIKKEKIKKENWAVSERTPLLG